MNAIEIFSKLHDIVPQSVLFSIFGLMCIIFGVSSFVLIFHWNRYAMDRAAIFMAQAVYFLGGLLILFIGFASVVSY
jgi:hypothetical protein